MLENKKWELFAIEDLFDVKIGKSIDGNKVDKENGNIPYITRKESNNGLEGFIDYNNEYMNKEFPVITIGNETAQPYVQIYPFFTGTKVNILKPKNVMNKYTLFFICQALLVNKSKYSYSFTINSTRLKKQNITLPINDKGEIDILYMEDYIKNIVYMKAKKYMEYKNI